MANSFTQSVDLSAVQTVVDAIRAVDVPALAAEHVAIDTVVDAIRATDVPALTLNHTDMMGTGFNPAMNSLKLIHDDNADGVVASVAVRAVTDVLSPLLPASGTIKVLNDFDVSEYVLSADIICANDAEKGVSAAAYAKSKEIKCKYAGTLRIVFDLYGYSGAGGTIGKIYKNGAPLGTERTWYAESWETYSEDLVFALDDTIELWCKQDAGFPTDGCRNFRVLGNFRTNFYNTLE